MSKYEILDKAIAEQATTNEAYVILSCDYDNLRWYAERLRAKGYTVKESFMQITFNK